VNGSSENQHHLDIVEGQDAPAGTRRLCLSGQLDVETTPALQEQLRRLLAAGARRVELDCADLRFVSSTGIGMLIACIGEYRDAGSDLALMRLRPEVEGVLRTIGLLEFLQDARGML
jgi:anti-sigma B factor antagonist